MSSTIDQRIVQMKFDNSDFEKGVSQTLESLDKLNQSIEENTKTNKSFSGLQNMLDKLDFSKIGDSIENISDKFNVWGVVGAKVITDLTAKAEQMAVKIGKSLSGIDNASAGWTKYGEKTSNVATLVSQGYDLSTVETQLEKLMWYTDETSYDFSSMVQNIGKFTAAGQKLDDSVVAMEGIANWAASAGQGASKATAAMYQLSQAMGKGALKLDDYKSIQNASMDTMEFRKKCTEAAVELGTLKRVGTDTYQTLNGNTFTLTQFTNQLTEDQWLSSKVMMKVFTQYAEGSEEVYNYIQSVKEETGETITASEAMERLGYNLTDFKAKVFLSAQECRTFADMLGSLADAGGTAWMNLFETIFGNYAEAKALWTGFANGLWDYVTAIPNTLNDIFGVWKNLGGRTKLLQSVLNVLNAINRILDPIKKAFDDVFGNAKDWGSLLAKATGELDGLTAALKISSRVMTVIYTVMKFVFNLAKAIFKIITPKRILAIGAALMVVKSALSILSPTHTLLGRIVKVIKILIGLGVFKKLTNGKVTLQSIANLISKLIEKFTGLKVAVDASVVKGFGSSIWNKAKNAISSIIPYINLIANVLYSAGLQVAAFAKKFDLINRAKSSIISVKNAIPGIFTAVKSGVSTVVKYIKPIVSILKSAGLQIVAFVKKFDLLNRAKSSLVSVKNTIPGIFTSIKSGASTAVTYIKKIASVLNTVGSQAVSIGKNVGSTFSKVGSKALTIIKKVASTLKNAISSIKSTLKSSNVTASMKNVGNNIQSTISKLITWIQKQIKDLQNHSFDIGAFLSDVIGGVKTTVGEVISFIIEGLHTISDKIVSFISNIEIEDPFAMKAYAAEVGTNFGEVKESVEETTQETTSFANETERANTNLKQTVTITSWIGRQITGLTNTVNSLRNGIDSAFSSIAKSLTGVSFKGINDFLNTIQNSKANNALQLFANGLASLWARGKDINWGKILGIAIILAYIAVIKKVVTSVDSFSKSLTNFTENLTPTYKSLANHANTLMDSIGGVGKSISGYLTYLQKPTWDKVFKSFAASVLMLAGAMGILALIPTDKLMDVGIVLGMLAAACVVSANAFANFAERVDAGQLFKISLSMLSLSAAVLVLTTSFAAMAKVMDQFRNEDGTVGLNGFLQFGTVIASGIVSIFAFTAAINVLSQVTPQINQASLGFLKISGSLLVLAGSIYAIDKAMTPFGDIVSRVAKRLYQFSSIAIETIKSLVSAAQSGDFGKFTDIATTIIEAVVAFIAADYLIKQLAKMLEKSANMLSEAGLKLAGCVIAFAVSVAILGFVAVNLSQYGEELAGGLTAMGVVIVALGAFFVAMEKFKIKKSAFDISKSILAFTASVFALSLAVQAMAKLKWNEALVGVPSMVVALIALAGAIKIMDMVVTNKVAAGVLSLVAAMYLLLPLFIIFGALDAKTMWNGVLLIGVAMLSLAGSVKLMEKAVPQNIVKILGTLIVELVAFGLVIGALANSGASWIQIAVSAAGVAGGLVVMAYGVRVLIEALHNFSWKEIGKLSAMMLMMAVTVEAFGAAVYFVAQNDWKSIVAACAGLAVGFTLMCAAASTMADAMSKTLMSTGEFVQFLATMVVAAASIGIIAGAVSLFAKMPWESIITGCVGLGVAFLAMAKGVTMVAKVFNTISAETIAETSAALIFASVAMMGVGLAISLLEGMSWQNIISGALGLSVAFLAMSAGLSILAGAFSEISVSQAATLMGVLAVGAASIIGLSLALNLLAGVDWGTILQAIAMIATATVSLSVMVAVFDNFSTGAVLLIPVLVSAAAAFMIFVAAINMLVDVDWGTIGEAVALIVVATAALSVMAVVFNEFAAGAIIMIPVLISAAAAFVAMAVALNMMIAVDWGTIGQAAVMIGILTLAFTLLSVVFTAFAPGAVMVVGVLVALAAVFVSIGVAAVMFGAAATLVGVGATLMASAFTQMTVALSAMLISFEQFMLFITSMSTFAGNISTLASSLKTFATALVALGAGATVAAAGGALLTIALAALNKVLLTASKVLVTCGKAFLNFANSVSTGLRRIGTGFTTLGTGISIAINQITMAIRNAAILGSQLIAGFVQGIAGGLRNVIAAAGSIGTVAIAAVKKVLDINSPSGVFEAIAGFCMKGFNIGIDAGLIDVKDIGGKIWDTCKGGLNGLAEMFGLSGIASGKSFLSGFGNTVEKGKDWLKENTDIDLDELGLDDIIKAFTGDLDVFGDYGDLFNLDDFMNTSELTNGMEDLTDVTGDYAGALDDASDSSSSASKSASDLAKKQKTLAKYTKYSTAVTKTFAAAYGGVFKILGDTSATDAATAAFSTLFNKIYTESQNASDSVEDSTESATDKAQAMQEAFNEAFESIKTSVEDSIDMFSKFDKGLDDVIKPSKMIENAKSQVAGVIEYYESLNTLALKGFSDDVISDLADEGTAGYSKMLSMMKATASEVEEINKVWESKEAIGYQAAITAMTARMTAIQMESFKKQVAARKEEKTQLEDAQKAYKAYAKLANDAYADGKDIAEELKDENSDLSKSYKTLRESMEKAGLTNEDLNKAMKSGEGFESQDHDIEVLNAALADYKKTAKEVADQGKDITEESLDENSKLGKSYQTLLAAVNKAGFSMEDLYNVMYNDAAFVNQTDYVNGLINVYTNCQQILTEFSTVGDGIFDNVQSQMEGMITYFSECDTEFEMTAADIRKNLKDQLKLMTDYNTNITKIIAMGGGKLVSEYGDKITAEVAAALVSGGSSLISETYNTFKTLEAMPYQMASGAQSAWQQYGQIGGLTYNQALTQSMNAQQILADMGVIGTNVSQGLANGMSSSTGLVTTQAAATAQALVDQIHSTTGCNSPSTITTAIGRYIDQGLINGMRNGMPLATQMAQNVSKNIVSTFRSNLTRDQFESIGKNISAGVASGITSGAATVVSAAANMAKSALAKAKSVLGIHSPSKEFKWVGKMSDAGMASGIEQNSGMIDDSIAYALKTALQSAYDILNSDVDMNPTITPVIDLSDAQNGAMLLSDMLNGQDIGFKANADIGHITTNADKMNALMGSFNTPGGVTYGDTILNVYGTQGQNVNQLADVVIKRLNNEYARRKAAWT